MIKLVAAVNIGFFALVVLVTLFALHGSIRLLVIGVLCAALTIGMYASPMAAMVVLCNSTFSYFNYMMIGQYLQYFRVYFISLILLNYYYLF
jgi:solute carrier family 50 (sugar transporter)